MKEVIFKRISLCDLVIHHALSYSCMKILEDYLYLAVSTMFFYIKSISNSNVTGMTF